MDKIEVTQDDKDAAASLMSDVGLFSNVLTAKAVQAFARHRLATRTDATPVAWEWRVKGTTDWIMQRVYPNPSNDRTDIERRALYTHPPATDVAALVENGCEMPEVAAMRYIEELRSDLAASVTILCDNEEAWTKDEQMAVEVIAEWTDWIAKRFMGESVIQCLARAIGARATLAALKDRTHG